MKSRGSAVSVTVAVAGPLVAVIVAVPGAVNTTRPFGLTIADDDEELYVIGCPTTESLAQPSNVAVRTIESPTSACVGAAERVRDFTTGRTTIVDDVRSSFTRTL